MSSSDIAIVGMACVFPGAKDLSGFWTNIVNGVDFVTQIPRGRFTQTPPFDPAKYDIRSGIVSTEDPEQLLMLDVIAAALKDADLASNDQIQERTDLIIGRGEIASLAAPTSSPFASEIASWLNLKGTSYTIDAGWISSLMAIEQGVTRLRQNRCDAVVVGGIYIFDKSHSLLLSEGAGAAILKRRSDAECSGNRIYGLIKGVVSTTLSIEGQALNLQQVYRDAGIEPGTIGFLETNGSGISDSDITEKETLRSIFGLRDEDQPVRPMSSAKSPIGQTMAAAGMASFIKTALCLSNKIIPPSLHCEEPRAELEDFPFYINTQTRPWIHDFSLPPRRAAINAFGFDGTNTHIILEEIQAEDKISIIREIKPGLIWETELVVFTARTPTELASKVRQLQQFLGQDHLDVQLEDIAYTLYLNFVESDPCRIALVCKDLNQLRDYLAISHERLSLENVHFDDIDDIYYTPNSSNKPGKIACLFPGFEFPNLLGFYWNCMQDLCLYFPEARAVFDRVDRRDGNPQDPLPTNYLLLPPMYLSEKERKKIRQRFDSSKLYICLADPSKRNLTPFGIAVANWVSWTLLEELHVPVDMMFGQSFGDLSALCASGALNAEELIPIYWQLPVDTSPLEDKGLLALVSTSEGRLKPLLQKFPDVTIAIHVRPELQVLGGESTQLGNIMQILKEQGVWTQSFFPYLAVHTPLFSPLRRILETFSEDISIRRPMVPVYSAITCGPYPQDAADIQQTMLDNLDHPAHIWQTYKRMYDDGARIFVQSGGGTTMHAQAKAICGEDNVVVTSVDSAYRSVITQINHLCAILLTNGVTFNIGYLFKYRSPRNLEIDYPMEYVDQQNESLSPGPKTSTKDGQHPTTSESDSDRQMPFIGTVLHYTPQKEIVVERVLDLSEDMYLRDHLFIHAPGIKPPSACLPILPMTITMEAMAEVAACLVPGFGIIGFEDIKASRWIALENIETMVLRISAQLADYDHETLTYRIGAAVLVEDGASPVASATILFGRHYLQSIDMEFTELINPHPFPLKAEEIYRDRRLFHGPIFRCICGDMILGDQGLTGELTVLSKDRLFASIKTPELLTYPVLLDGIGQLVGLWAQVDEMYIFPVGIGRLEIYNSTPPVGTRVPVRLQITQVNPKTLYADIEVQDGTGQVWMRIEGWGDWIFRWPKKLCDFRRFPTKYVITQDIYLPCLPQGSVCQTISRGNLCDFDLDTAAGFYLHLDEIDTFRKLDNNPVRQFQWLLGRIVAKEAVRLWLAKETKSAEMPHPASFVIENDPNGQPFIISIAGLKTPPRISIAHSNDRAVAIATRGVIGIDLELISHRDNTFLESFATPKERDILNRFPTDERDTWITRLWCAKEAVGKALGMGLDRNLQSFELHNSAPDGHITIHHHESDCLFSVYTHEDQDFIVAYTSPG